VAHRFEERVGWQECGETAGVVVQVQKVRNVGMAQKNHEEDNGGGGETESEEEEGTG
jgi:hypothetical protein